MIETQKADVAKVPEMSRLPKIEEVRASPAEADAERAELIAERVVGPIAATCAYIAKDTKFKYGKREARIAHLDEVVIGLQQIADAVVLGDLPRELAAAKVEAVRHVQLISKTSWDAGGSAKFRSLDLARQSGWDR